MMFVSENDKEWHACELYWILVIACPWMRYAYKNSVVCSKCKHYIIRDYIFEHFCQTKGLYPRPYPNNTISVGRTKKLHAL